jgi:hypothetical protein
MKSAQSADAVSGVWHVQLSLTLTIVLAALSSTAEAQGPPVVLGARVRVSVSQPANARHTGVLRAADGTSVQLQTSGESLTIPRSTITRLEQSLGKKPNGPGGIIGALLGVAVGGAVGCLANKDDYGVYCAGQDDTKVIVGAVVGGLAGAVVGALVFKKEGWREAALPR